MSPQRSRPCDRTTASCVQHLRGVGGGPTRHAELWWRALWPEYVQQRTRGNPRAHLVRRSAGAWRKFCRGGGGRCGGTVQNRRADLANEELMALEQERATGEEGEDGSPAARQLTARYLSKALAHFDAGPKIVSDNDPNLERSLRVCRGVSNVVSCCRDLLREKRGPKWWGAWSQGLSLSRPSYLGLNVSSSSY